MNVDTVRVYATFGGMQVECETCRWSRFIIHRSVVESSVDHARRIAAAHVCGSREDES